MTAQLSLLQEPPSVSPTATQRWLEALRAALLRERRGEIVTTDDVWALAETRPELRMPAGTHSNALGPFFAQWESARPVMVAPGQQMMRKSERPGARGNMLRCWRIA